MLRLGEWEYRAGRTAMIRNVLRWCARRQQRISDEIPAGQNDMAHVHRVFGDEAMSPVVHRLTELSRAGLGLKKTAIEAKTEVGSKNRDCRRLWALARSDHSLLAV